LRGSIAFVKGEQPTTVCYTLADDAPEGVVAQVYRAALAVLRPRLEDFSIDLISDHEWPSETGDARAALRSRTIPVRRFLRPWKTNPGYCVELDPGDDADMELAAALVPWTIHAEGIARDQSIAYSVNDTGTSAAFELTTGEHQRLVALLHERGVDGRYLVVLPRRRKQFN
jgi:hypothetical protein